MAVRFQCKCGKKLKASDEKIGKKVLCSGCGKSIRVPDADAAPAKAPVAAVSTTSTSASHIASDLLKRTDTEVKSRMPTEADPRPESEVDYAGSIRNFGMSVLPGAGIFIVVVGAAYLLSSTLFSASVDRPELVEVSGIVTLDGQPLASARVEFRPVPEPGNIGTDNLGSSYGRTNADGKFTLFYVKDVPGAVLGLHRIEIRARGRDGRPLVPPAYNRMSRLTYKVEAEGTEEANFQLISNAQAQ